MESSLRRREQEVWHACDDLWALYGDMKLLTGDAIRERLVSLGKSRGSPNEIYKYRKTWGQSRGLSLDASMPASSAESDPISRAVKMVHEKLQLEASEQIDRLRAEYEKTLAQKDEQIAHEKQALERVMTEFAELQRELEQRLQKTRALKEELAAEIEVRKAVERELHVTRSLREQEKRAGEELLKEIKICHEQEILATRQRDEEHARILQAELAKALEEKKKLGFEYSETLTELKAVIYNKDVQREHLEKKLTERTEELHALKIEHDACNHKIEMAKETLAHSEQLLAKRDGELCAINHLLASEKSATKQQSYLLKRAELVIARLRTERAHNFTMAKSK